MKNLYKIVENVLCEALGDRVTEIRHVTNCEYPFLLLITNYDVAGFVVLNGNAKEIYKLSYAQFKKFYRNQHKQWQKKTLSLVVCPIDSNNVQAAFLNELENDVYFCKKYVVRHCDVPETFKSEITRLPFIPLHEGKFGGIIRPLSAQTLLQEIGVGTDLARQLIVAGYSPESILKEIIREKREASALGMAPKLTIERQPHVPKPTRVTSIAIQGFRAYKKSCEFDLDAGLIVLFGPNGLGKTSFFDALDFVCTGRIGRLCPGRISHSRFVDLARHLDTAPQFGHVTLKGTYQSDTIELIRYVNDWTFASLNKERLSRVPVLKRLTSAQWPEKTPRIENIEKLFRSTHLFSQTDPELLSSFMDKSIITANLLSRMLALDDYATGIDKSKAVLNLIKRRVADAEEESKTISFAIDDAQTRLKSLDQSEAEGVTTETAEHLASEVKDYLTDVERVQTPDESPNVVVARDWRVTLQGALEEAQEKSSTIKELQAELSKMILLKQQKLELTETIKGLSVDAKMNRDSFANLIKEKEDLEGQSQEIDDEIKEMKQTRLKISDAKILKTQFPSLKAENERLINKIRSSESQLAKLDREKQALEQTLKETDEKIEQYNSLLSEQSVMEKTLSGLVQRAKKWKSDRLRKDDFKKNIKLLNKRKEGLSKKHQIEEQKLHKIKAESRIATGKYNKLSSDLSEMTKLLDQIEEFITSDVCPLCGTRHETMDNLLSEIRDQKQKRPVSLEKSANDVQRIKTDCSDFQASIDELTSQVLEIDDSVSAKSNEIEALSRKITSFENDVIAAGFNPNSNSILSIIQKACDDIDAVTRQVKASSKTEKDKRDLNAAKLLRITNTREKVTTELLDDRRHAETNTFKQQDLQRKIKDAGIQVTTENRDIEHSIKELNNKLETAENKLSDLSKAISSKNKEITKCKNDFKSLIKRHNLSEERLKDTKKKLNLFIKKLEVVGLPQTATSEMVNNRAKELRTREKRLVIASEKSRFLEKILDAAAKSLEIAELESHLKKLSAQKEQLRFKLTKLHASRKWLHRIRDSLRGQREVAVQSHISAYGPLSTVIQKRLRSVYGFGDIQLEPIKDEIHVKVSWASEFVRPTDYFSESQKQILMLSLFMAGRLTQTWSGFSPILMDDPVTHFDDLNAYSFVELLRGLLENAQARQQYFISTCEERLYRLMRDKLSNLGSGSRFYEFKAMTPDGPEVVAV